MTLRDSLIMTMNIVLISAVAMLLLSAKTALAADDFLISYWCGVKTTADMDTRYAEVKECGFTYASMTVDFWSTTVESNIKMLDACQKQGIKCIILDVRIFNVKPENADFTKVLDDIVNDYSKHPAFAGYFLSDEPNFPEFPRLVAIRNYLKKKDPKHFSYVNLLPTPAVPRLDYVEEFCRQFKPEILSYDHYALQVNKTTLEGYFSNLGIVRTSALKHHIPACNIIQAIAGGAWRDPTEAEYRWQVNTSLVYGFKGIMYFYYWTPPLENGGFNDGGMLDSDGNRTHRYDRIKRVNASINTLAPTLMKLTSTAVYHTGSILRGEEPYPPTPQAKQASDRPQKIDMFKHYGVDKWTKVSDRDLNVQIRQVSGGPLIIGMFKHKDGSTWAMVVNRDFMNTTKAKLRFMEGIHRVQEMSSRTGLMRDIELRNDAAEFYIPAGDEVLLKLE